MDFLTTLDWAAIAKIVGVDLMLGVDNAIIIAMACATLPKGVRGKAVLLGTAGAVGLRAVLLACAGFLMNIPYVKLVAGAYLLFLGYKLLAESDDSHEIPAADRVLTAVKTIIVADFMMSLDNVLAVAGAAAGAGEHSTLYAVAGIVFSIPVIVFGATGLMSLMSRFPVIVWVGAGLLGWVGAEMVIADPLIAPYVAHLHDRAGAYTNKFLEAAGFLLVITAVGLARLVRRSADTQPVGD